MTLANVRRMNLTMESQTTHPLQRKRTGHQKMPQLGKPLVPTSFDKLKTQKIAKMVNCTVCNESIDAFI